MNNYQKFRDKILTDLIKVETETLIQEINIKEIIIETIIMDIKIQVGAIRVIMSRIKVTLIITKEIELMKHSKGHAFYKDNQFAMKDNQNNRIMILTKVTTINLRNKTEGITSKNPVEKNSLNIP